MSEAQQISAAATRPAYPRQPSSVAVVGVVALAIFTVWITWRAKRLETLARPENRPLTLLNKPAPDFTLPTLDGRSISLAAYRPQKKVVVSFWASWCGPCRLELPVLKSFYEKAHKPGSDFEFLAISVDDDRESAEQAAREMKLPFPVLLDPHEKAAGAYDVAGIPMLFIVDKAGRVSYGNVGFDIGIESALAQQLGVDPKLIFPEGGPNAAARH